MTPACFVRVCPNQPGQQHHVAPRDLFSDSDDWPTVWLCQKHHSRWHQVMTPATHATGVEWWRKSLGKAYDKAESLGVSLAAAVRYDLAGIVFELRDGLVIGKRERSL